MSVTDRHVLCPRRPRPAATSPRSPPELAKVLARIGRGLRYRTRAAREALDITHSEGELLRLLDRQPGHPRPRCRRRARHRLQLRQHAGQAARPRRAARAQRRPAGRPRRLPAADAARRGVGHPLGNAREAALDRALATLDQADRDQLEAAIPAMTRLAKAIARSGGPPQ